MGQEILDQRQSVGEGGAADQGGQGLRWAWISSTKVLSPIAYTDLDDLINHDINVSNL